MKIDIDRFGFKNVPVDPETVFTFPQGLLGFETNKRFKIFHDADSKTVFWLQSLDDSAVTFPTVSPDTISIEYEIELSDDDCKLLELASPEDIAVAVIVYRNEADGGKVAANTQSPIVLNLKNRKGMQKLLKTIDSTLTFRAR